MTLILVAFIMTPILAIHSELLQRKKIISRETPTNVKNTRLDFSENFHNIKEFLQVDHLEKIIKLTASFFRFHRFRKIAGGRKMFEVAKINAYRC
jgi:hypothetical protein